MKGAYSFSDEEMNPRQGVRGVKMKGAYSQHSWRNSCTLGVRDVKMKGSYSDSWDIATKV